MMTGIFAQYFTPADYLISLPLVLLALFAGGILVMDTMMPRSWRAVNGWTALMGLAFSAAALSRAYLASLHPDRGFVVMNGLFGTFVLDRVTLAATVALLVTTAVVFLITLRANRRENELSGAFCAAVLLALLGMICVVGAHDMVLLLVSMQLVVLALSLLLAVSEPANATGPQWDAAWKLLIAGTLSTGALAFIFSLLYALSGQTALLAAAGKLEGLMRTGAVPQQFLGLVAFSALLVLGTLAPLMPFSSWSPFSLEHAAPSVCVMLAAGLPLVAWPLAIRLFGETLYPIRATLVPLFVVVGLFSLVVGSLAMLLQGNLHRFLAYAAASQAGFLLLGFSGSFVGEKPAPDGLLGVFMHVPALAIALAGCYALSPMVASRRDRSARVEDLAGLFHRSRFEAVLMTVLLASLAGLPLAGFWGRYTLLQALWLAHPMLAITAGLFSVIALVGYLRLMVRMMDGEAARDAYGVPRKVATSWSLRLVLTLSAVALIAGAYSAPVQSFVKWMLYL